MPALNAFDAISPAFARTKLILFSPFRKGRTWKLAATAYLTMAGTTFIPFPLLYLVCLPLAFQAGGKTAVEILIGATILVLLLYLVFFYVVSRLRFALFDIVANHGQFVAPAWRKYGPQSFRWTLFKVLLGTLFTAAIAAPTAAYIKQIVSLFSKLHLAPGQQPPPGFYTAIFTGYAAFFLVYIAFALFWLATSLLSDIIVPLLALENLTLSAALRRALQFVRNEPGQLSLYAIVKVGLAFAGYMSVTLVAYAIILIAALVVGLIGFIGYLLLHAIHVPNPILIGIGAVVGMALYFVLFFYLIFIGMGALIIFLESFALYFIAGRYAPLAELLAASTPPPAYLPAQAYPNFYPPPPNAE
jgi:hypothetical protein